MSTNMEIFRIILPILAYITEFINKYLINKNGQNRYKDFERPSEKF